MHIIATIIPIFTIIGLGWLARQKGFIPPDFLGTANRLVYYLAIPAMLFRLLCQTSLKTQFHAETLSISLACILAVFCFAWIFGTATGIGRHLRGTFMQSAVHGNLGYIGLAVAYYALGKDGLIRAGILSGFIIVLQNLLGVLAHQLYSRETAFRQSPMAAAEKILGNPVIISSSAGIVYNLSGLPLPLVFDQSLKILGDLALPMALLVIGASLSFEMMRRQLGRVLSSGFMKLVLLPALGWGLFRLFGIAEPDYLPALILLASPTATVTYVMAKELHGDPDFAVAAISASTMLSCATFSGWLLSAGIGS